MVHSTRTVSSDLARQLLEEMNEEESHCAKYYRSNLQLACKYIEEKAAISSQQRNTGDIRSNSSQGKHSFDSARFFVHHRYFKKKFGAYGETTSRKLSSAKFRLRNEA